MNSTSTTSNSRGSCTFGSDGSDGSDGTRGIDGTASLISGSSATDSDSEAETSSALLSSTSTNFCSPPTADMREKANHRDRRADWGSRSHEYSEKKVLRFSARRMREGGFVQSHCRQDQMGTRRVRFPCISTLRERKDMVFKTMSSRTILVATSDGERCGEAIVGKRKKQRATAASLFRVPWP